VPYFQLILKYRFGLNFGWVSNFGVVGQTWQKTGRKPAENRQNKNGGPELLIAISVQER
jgi:hypothetical protein